MSCPSNSIHYNGTLCACAPGHVLNLTTNSCSLFSQSSTILTDSGIDISSLSFPTIFSFDSIKKFTQSQAIFLEATLVLLFLWLVFCFFMRFIKLGDGNDIGFKIRWWISRLDICFATRHWLEDQRIVKKRKTELGGTFSMASWILFIGLFAALLYQIISKRTIEVHNVKAANAPDLISFVNDVEFNITTVSSMSCANLRNLGTLVTGNPGFIDYRVTPLSDFAKYSCHNTSNGPTITLKCNNCQLIQDNLYISWQFVDLPNTPATAVGFQFNLTAKNNANKKHVSFVSGTLKNGSIYDDRPVTFRGVDANILKVNLFPRIYHNLKNLKLIQPLFHQFLPGSSFHETTQLQASLENPNDGLINTTLYVNFLSAYIVEINNQSIMGPVSFLADLGGLYCISIAIFFFCLVQCEYRIKRLRNEDSVLRKIRNQRKAQERWDKLRKYVMYTWGCSALGDNYKSNEKGSCCSSFMVQSVRGNGSFRKNESSLRRKQQSGMDSISFNRKLSLPSKKNEIPECSSNQGVKSCIAEVASIPKGNFTVLRGEPPLKCKVLGSSNGGKQYSFGLYEGDVSQQITSHIADGTIPPPPLLEMKDGSKMDISDIQKNLQSLYEYNVMLREKYIAVQSLLNDLATHSSSPVKRSQT